MKKHQRRVILVIDDEAPVREVLKSKLTRQGFSVISAKNGLDGLAVARRERPDLILLDLIMPEMDGITMLKKLRRDAWGKTVPVIILTNLLSENEEVNKFLTQSKHSFYLVKTEWSIADLIIKIHERLGGKSSALLPSSIHRNHPSKGKNSMYTL